MNVLTRSYDRYRAGACLSETRLTPDYLRAHGLRHLFDLDLEDDARGTEGQVLAVSALVMLDGLAHDVAFVADMANNVHAFDLATGQRLWKQHVGNPVKSSPKIDMYNIADHWGILSTPVINLATKTIFVVAMTSPTGTIGDSHYVLHALSLIDGHDQAAPLDLAAATYQPPNGLPLCRMGNVPRKQRCGLLGDFGRNGVDTVFIANGSFKESFRNQGWIIACDVTGLKLSIGATWTTTARYSGGGIWQGGQAPAMDDAGHVYGMTGNGSFDGITDFGESFYKLRYAPRTSIANEDWWTPYTDTGRLGADPTLPDVSLIKGAGGRPGGPTNADDPGDEDLNSGGPLLLPKSLTGYSKNVVLGAGKDGILYVVDADNMGRSKLSDFAPDKIAGNYAKLLSPPYGFTYFPAGMDLAPTDLSTLQTTYGGRTHHQHSTPVFYRSPTLGPMLFTGGENGPVRAFKFNSDFTLTYVACGAEIASATVPDPGGMAGTMIVLSANGGTANTGVLFGIQPYGDANKTVTNGRLLAYAADQFNGGTMVKLWDSQDWGITFMAPKFNIPTVCNSRVIVPSYDGRVLVLG